MLAEKAQSLANNYFDRKNAYPHDMQVLLTGFWYANDYFEALTFHKQQPRIDHFKKRGDFFHGLPPKGFVQGTSEESYTGKIWHYQIADNVSATTALSNIKETLCFIDCLMMLEIAYYETFLHVFGSTWFDSFFGPQTKNALKLAPHLGSTPLAPFVDDHQTTNTLVGDIVYFRNPPMYSYRHINGESKGFFTMCIQKGEAPLLTFLGSRPEGATEEGMLELCVEEFNREPLPPCTICTPELEKKILEGIFSKNPERTVLEHNVMLERAKTTQIDKKQLVRVHENDPAIAGRNPYVFCPKIASIRKLFRK